MTKNEQAIELVNLFKPIVHGHSEDVEQYNAIQAAKIVVEYVLKSSPSLPLLSDNGSFSSDIIENKEWWGGVMAELETM